MSTYRVVRSDELEHYGVVGMRWGVRKDKDKAYAKSMKKLSALDKKAQKKKDRSDKYSAKADRKAAKANTVRSYRKSQKLTKQAHKNYVRAHRTLKSSIRARKRAEKWVNEMNKTFTGMTVGGITSDQISLGRKYYIEVLENSLKDK